MFEGEVAAGGVVRHGAVLLANSLPVLRVHEVGVVADGELDPGRGAEKLAVAGIPCQRAAAHVPCPDAQTGSLHRRLETEQTLSQRRTGFGLAQ